MGEARAPLAPPWLYYWTYTCNIYILRTYLRNEIYMSPDPPLIHPHYSHHNGGGGAA